MEVLATDNNTVIAFIGKGAYFGEIGVLITGKRSVSIRALSNCMTYIVKSNDFLNILDRFPE
jgi:CRP-like cAMP-binding protein